MVVSSKVMGSSALGRYPQNCVPNTCERCGNTSLEVHICFASSWGPRQSSWLTVLSFYHCWQIVLDSVPLLLRRLFLIRTLAWIYYALKLFWVHKQEFLPPKRFKLMDSPTNEISYTQKILFINACLPRKACIQHLLTLTTDMYKIPRKKKDMYKINLSYFFTI